MNQIFRDHLPYMMGGVLAGIALLCVPGQSKWSKRLSGSICLLTWLYPAMIVLLYVRREDLGESYAYLVLGILGAILLAIIAGVLFLSWTVTYLVVLKRKRKETRTSNHGAHGSLPSSAP